MRVAETDRKISQLDNDVHSIYDMLSTVERVQDTHGQQLSAVQKVQDTHGQQLSALQKVQDTHGQQLSALQEVQDTHGQQLESLQWQVSGIEKRLTCLTHTVTSIWTTQQNHDNRLNDLDVAVAVVNEQLKEMNQRFEQRFEHTDQRFEQVERRLEKQDHKLDLIMKALNISVN